MSTGAADRPPSVDAVARSLRGSGLPQPLLVDAAREAITAGTPDRAMALAEERRDALLRAVINATGVLLHTNLGRAPLPTAYDASYLNLEIDMDSGERGSRRAHVGPLLARACGAEAGLVVNNGAGAMLLVLAALARGRSVAVSRGELIEIGGGFRLPDVMVESGAQLVEVGTTNRTRLSDYQRIADDVQVVLKVHASNYEIVGFTESVSVSALATLGPPVVVDLGSGLLDASCPWLPSGPPPWLSREPGVRQSVESGAAVVVFSGDKLLGGPQAGIIVGRTELLDACAAHPLYRALRPGALILQALQDVALTYLSRDAAQLSFWRMATASVASLRRRADELAASLPRNVESCATKAVAGGGSAPGMEVPSWGLAVEDDHLRALRQHRPRPVIGRVRDGRTWLDLRTVEPRADAELRAALVGAVGSGD